MKDLHSHVLFGIDDGSKSIEESVEILREASKQGITDMIVTPHYMEGTKYNCNNKMKRELFQELLDKVFDEDIDIRLHLGNEVYLTEEFLELLEKDEIMTLNDSKYLLLEFPLNNMIVGTGDILFKLIGQGYIPVLAHPERYKIFQRHPEHIMKYLDMGVLLQGNFMSLYGKYGKEAKKTLKFYLKKGWITFLGSDIHHVEDLKLKKLRKVIKSIVKDDKKVDDLLENNFDMVISDKVLEIKR